MYKSLIVISSFCSLFLFSSCSAQVSYDQYQEVVSENFNLREDNQQLTKRYNDLLEKFSLYQEEIVKWEKQTKEAIAEYEKKIQGAVLPPYISMNGRKASFSFRNLNEDLESWSIDVQVVEGSVIKGTFMRNLSFSELERFGASEIAQEFYTDSKYVYLSSGSRVIDCRPYCNETLPNLTAHFFEIHTDDETRIREIWNMVTQLSIYTGEMKETPRLPYETLLFGGGDCEDLAILTASLLRSMSSEWEIKFVYMDGDSPEDCKDVNHVAVWVDTGTYKTFVESTQAVEMCPFNLVDGYYFEVP
jgi:hypothetical protein